MRLLFATIIFWGHVIVGYSQSTSVVSPNLYEISLPFSDANIVFLGINNPVVITKNGNKYTQLEMEVDNGTITKTALGYNLRVKTAGTVVISGFEIKGRVKRLRLQKKFTSKMLSNPEVCIDSYYLDGRSIPAKVLQGNDGLSVCLADVADSKKYFKLLAFNISYQNEILNNHGAIFNENVKKVFRNLKPGDKISFSDIMCKGTSGEMRVLHDCTVFIQ
jgi:hypothetical protein